MPIIGGITGGLLYRFLLEKTIKCVLGRGIYLHMALLLHLMRSLPGGLDCEYVLCSVSSFLPSCRWGSGLKSETG